MDRKARRRASFARQEGYARSIFDDSGLPFPEQIASGRGDQFLSYVLVPSLFILKGFHGRLYSCSSCFMLTVSRHFGMPVRHVLGHVRGEIAARVAARTASTIAQFSSSERSETW